MTGPAPAAAAAPVLDPPGGRRAVAVWCIGVAVYFVAVIFRTSLGVAGLDAADRFHVNASALATFSLLQLLVYAGMQIPVGLMVDRLGTKKVLTLGAVLFTAGQLGFALSPSYGMALAARALLGCGDAMTFISVLRLGTRWFPARRGPLMAQLAGLVGMAGNLVSTLVLSARAGGAIVGSLRNLTVTLEQRKETRREIRTQLSQVTVTAYLVPAIGLGSLLLVDMMMPGALDRMTGALIGQTAVLVALGLFTLGFVLIRRLSKIDV